MIFEQYASGKKFQEILEEAFIHPLNIEGELYVGIPPGNSHDYFTSCYPCYHSINCIYMYFLKIVSLHFQVPC